MGRAFNAEEIIDRPAAEVWQVLTDWSQAPRWMNGIEHMSASGETAAGTTLTFHTRGKDRQSSITSCVDERTLVLQSVQGGMTADYAYGLEPLSQDQTKVTLVADCRASGLMWQALEPLIRIAIRKTDGQQLAALKNLIEGDGRA